MRPFVAFVVTGALLGVLLTFYIRLYAPDSTAPYLQATGVRVAILYPDPVNLAQQNEVAAISQAVQSLGLTDVKVGAQKVKSYAIPLNAQPYLWAFEIIAAFLVITPIFILYALVNWSLKIFE